MINAIIDLVENDSELNHYRKAGGLPIQPYDFRRPELSRWVNRGNPTQLYASGLLRFLTAVSRRQGIDLKGKDGSISKESIDYVLTNLTYSQVYSTPINAWGTILRIMWNPDYAVTNQAVAAGLAGKSADELPRVGPYTLAWITDDPTKNPELGEHDADYYRIRRIVIPRDHWKFPIWGDTFQLMPYQMAEDEMRRVDADLFLWSVPLDTNEARGLLFNLARKSHLGERLVIVTNSKNLNYNGNRIPTKNLIESIQTLGYN
jgi:hypothetical protein